MVKLRFRLRRKRLGAGHGFPIRCDNGKVKKPSQVVALGFGLAAFFAAAVYTMMRVLGLPISATSVAIMPMTFLLTFLPATLYIVRRKNRTGRP